MRQQQRIKDPTVRHLEIFRPIGLKTALSTHRNGCRIVINADSIAVVEEETSPNTATNVERSSQVQPAYIAPIRIG
jgi:hypothetical protein